jgi:MFS family permease
LTAAADTTPVWSRYTAGQRWGYLAVLLLVSVCNNVDRSVITVILEPIKAEFHVSDTMLGLLSGFAFALLYSTLGIPAARWADRGDRKLVIALSTAIWSVMTVVCGLVATFWQLALARVGVGAGEAGSFPASQSLIADYFPTESRGRAMSAARLAGGPLDRDAPGSGEDRYRSPGDPSRSTGVAVGFGNRCQCDG